MVGYPNIECYSILVCLYARLCSHGGIMDIVVVHAHMVAGMASDASFLRKSSSFYPHPRKIASVECPLMPY